MTDSKKNICSIIIAEKIDIKNMPSNLDIDLQILNDQISGHVNVTKSEIDPVIIISNLRKGNFNLNLNIHLNENSFLEMRDESEYNFGSKIIINTKMNKNSLFEYFRLNNFLETTKNYFNHEIEISSNCEFRDFNFSNGSSEMENKTSVSLNEENASYIGSGVMISNSTNAKNDLLINHHF